MYVLCVGRGSASSNLMMQSQLQLQLLRASRALSVAALGGAYDMAITTTSSGHTSLGRLKWLTLNHIIRSPFSSSSSSSKSEKSKPPRSAFSDAVESIRKQQALRLAKMHQQQTNPNPNPIPDVEKIRNKKLYNDFMASRLNDTSAETDLHDDDNDNDNDHNEEEEGGSLSDSDLDALTESLVEGLRGGGAEHEHEQQQVSMNDRDMFPAQESIVKVKDAVGPPSEGELRYLEIQKKLKYKREVRSKLIPSLEKKVRYRRPPNSNSNNSTERKVEMKGNSVDGRYDGNEDDEKVGEEGEETALLLHRIQINMTDAGFGISYDDEKQNPRKKWSQGSEDIDQVPMAMEDLRRLMSAKVLAGRREKEKEKEKADLELLLLQQEQEREQEELLLPQHEQEHDMVPAISVDDGNLHINNEVDIAVNRQ